jgi:hypothetical protein
MKASLGDSSLIHPWGLVRRQVEGEPKGINDNVEVVEVEVPFLEFYLALRAQIDP